MSTTSRGTTVRLPQLGESVTEGTIGAWLKQVGERVDKYDPLVEITTDKVNAEVPSPVSGVIVEIRAEEGNTLPVGAELCVIDEGGSAAAGVPAPAQPTPAEPSGHTNGHAAATVPPAAAESPVPPRQAGASEAEVLRTRSSPAVRRIAEEHGVDISTIQGTGLGGRVTKQDILRHVEEQRAAPAAARPVPAPAQPAVRAADRAIEETVSGPTPQEVVARPAAPPAAPPAPSPAEPVARPEVGVWEGDQVLPVSAVRRQVAEHMVRSERTAPHVTLWMEVDMSGVVAARARAQERFSAEEGFELTYIPFIIKATVHALREHPNVNAVWDEDRIIRRKALNIGVAVALEDGLVVPVIKHADERSIVGLARAVRDLALRARAGRLSVDEVQGGTFTVNNPGTFGTVLSTPIIVQPQSAILSTEAVVKRPVVVDDAITIRPIMNLSLSIDHRILDGMSAARFLGTVKRWLESVTADTSLY
ncbi:MAG TPA: dihydrolipoamide acetyltransferase family protein [Thermomicrobiaceae bacterium]|nr:dihydrolipoamide acetyltransferase family protein [Thermomicrobiaceae bacterium]